jgi:hypothetical protein
MTVGSEPLYEYSVISMRCRWILPKISLDIALECSRRGTVDVKRVLFKGQCHELEGFSKLVSNSNEQAKTLILIFYQLRNKKL